MLILAITSYVLVAIYEIKPLYKQKLWRDLWAYSVLGVFSFTIAILLCLNVDIPSPVKPIKEFIIAIFGKALGKIVAIIYIWYAFHLGALVLRNFGEFINLLADV